MGGVQTLYLNTSGGDNKNINLDATIDALFNIVSSSSVTNELNTFVRYQIIQIQKIIDVTFQKGFSNGSSLDKI